MKKRRDLIFLLVGWTAMFSWWVACPHVLTGQEKTPSTAEKLFALKVQPIFQDKCLGCHGENPDELEGGFDVRSRQSVLRGGDHFEDQAVVPGDSQKSHLYAMVRREEDGYEMPPKAADRLSEEETWAIRDWIAGGAPWPDEKRVAEIYARFADGVNWSTSGGLSEKWTKRKYNPADLWAYQPLKSVDRKFDGNPIDFFIDRMLEQRGLPPAGLADRRTLIRRATFDLTGLPPKPEAIVAFLEDQRSDLEAFGAVVDRLLASPRYGEQWGRHWLDVVRYADSAGFANDWQRPNAWRYRDYVIRSFNVDKPYDQFVREQLAGDEIAARNRSTKLQTDPEAARLAIATGFLRMGPWEHTGMSVAKVTRQQFLDDVTDSVGQVFLAHALQCCRCHDHKFDPVPTKDYYSIQAVFATTQFADVDAIWLPEENREGMEADRNLKQKKVSANQQLLGSISARQKEYERRWFKEKGLPYRSKADAVLAKAPPEHMPPAKVYWTPDDFGRERIARKWQTRLNWELDLYAPVAFSVINGKTVYRNSNRGRILPPKKPFARGKLESTSILAGGDVSSPTTVVTPGILSAASMNQKTELPQTPTGRRLALANWITHRDNPLTARVMVNRIWLYHFGKAIAGNPNNFGATGKKPTHPELLDWLARRLIDEKWSIKKMHRLIMLSRAYRRSSRHPDSAALTARDPGNRLYSVFEMRRLAAEELRDAMLAVSGEMNDQIGGIPCRPDMNLEAALQPRMIMGTFAPAYTPNPLPSQRNRRSVYALKLRGQRDPFLETFNQPGSEKSCEIRDRSMVTPQALTLLNSGESLDRAVALAIRVLRESAKDDFKAVERLYQLAYGRPPRPKEQSAAVDFWKTMVRLHSKQEFPLPSYPKEVVRTANEENTGKPFTFTERLFEYEEYVPDKHMNQVDARTRGFAVLCLTILNSNEFVFVD